MVCLRKIFLGVFCALALTMAGHIAAAQQTKACTATDADKPAVAETLRAMYAAGMKSDLKGFDALVTPNFYMYDGGRRFEGDEIMKYILEQYKQGYKYEWTVQEPVVEVDCNMAWIAYVNKGSMTKPDGTKKDLTWLESSVLEKHDGHWLLRFFHSTMVPQK
jgi:ketosteroid isomerase-like protein